MTLCLMVAALMATGVAGVDTTRVHGLLDLLVSPQAFLDIKIHRVHVDIVLRGQSLVTLECE